MRASHCYLYRFTREFGHCTELVNKAEVCRIRNRAFARCRRMRDVGVVLRDWLWLSRPMECRHFLPEVVEHRVRRGVSIMGPAMRLAPGNQINACCFLLQDRRLHGAELGIG